MFVDKRTKLKAEKRILDDDQSEFEFRREKLDDTSLEFVSDSFDKVRSKGKILIRLLFSPYFFKSFLRHSLARIAAVALKYPQPIVHV